MHIRSILTHIQSGLKILRELVKNRNDSIENGREKNLRLLSNTLPLDFPEGESFTVSELVNKQHNNMQITSIFLQGNNTEVQQAVEDLSIFLRI